MEEDEIRETVRKRYGEIIKNQDCCCSSSSCMSSNTDQKISTKIGYSNKELASVPEESDLGLGCGNPVALASLKEGETVLDLGSGAGLDCFLAANKVGETGKIIGVDMTPEMLDKSRQNLKKSKRKNIEFRLGEIENLPAADNSVNVVISNCVINLSPNKKRVFEEAFRVLKPGGRLMVSDIVLQKELPEEIRTNVHAYVGCISGALLKDTYIETVRKAGFKNVEIVGETPFAIEYLADDANTEAISKITKLSTEKLKQISNSVASIKVSAIKP